ncbi:hypothetical protein J4Q44_G00024290 [Coregonus suidteri]|uniref:Uncharacterized protein n=1 Tax=Coregonus suidteri TaxID=861788 RepID=A0AAN8MBF8_9TELE
MDEDSMGGGNGGCNIAYRQQRVSTSVTAVAVEEEVEDQVEDFNQFCVPGTPLLWERTLRRWKEASSSCSTWTWRSSSQRTAWAVPRTNSSSTAQIPSQSSQSAVPNQVPSAPPHRPHPALHSLLLVILNLPHRSSAWRWPNPTCREELTMGSYLNRV